MRWLVRVAASLLVLLAVAFGGGFLYLSGKGRPRRSGGARIEGLSGPVEVRFDRWGVPHVRAADALDLPAALGYLHANDRMTQLELGRRGCSGRLAEVIGARALPADRRSLHLRLGKTASRLAAAAGEESRLWLEAYARGVDAWLSARRGDLPPELVFLGVEPEPWTPADSLCFAVLMARDLSFPGGHPEEGRYRLLRALGAARARDLLGFPDLHVPDALAAEAAARTAGLAGALRPLPGAGAEGADDVALGSNNWAVGASRSATGAPLVANDPHLPLGLPPVWYQVHLRAPGFEAAGMTLPGLPGVVIGQTARLAWAFTNVELDDHDLFFEELDGEGRRVRRGAGWAPVTVERASIAVDGGGREEIVLRSTDRGPLFEPDPARGLPARSLAWTAHEAADPLSIFLGLAHAASVDEVPSFLGGYVAPAQNLVVADRQGGLSYTVLGRVPERRRGDGRLPAPAADPSYGWSGLRPRNLNPTVLRPAEDLLVTANHDIRPPGYALPFFANFYPPHRAERIRERLLGQGGWEASSLARLQVDTVSLHARQVVGRLGGPWEGEARRAHEALSGWDGAMDLEGPAALFFLVERELARAAFDDEAQAAGLASFASASRLSRLLAGEMDPSWFDDVGTPSVETRDELVGRALEWGWREALRRFGEGSAGFRYGDLHHLLLAHPLGALPLAGAWLNRGPHPVPGSGSSIAAFGASFQDDGPRVRFGPSMRWISDLADPDRSLAMLPGGQAGHPADPHYADQVKGFLAGRTRPVAWSEAAIAAATASVLTLEPAPGAGGASRGAPR